MTFAGVILDKDRVKGTVDFGGQGGAEFTGLGRSRRSDPALRPRQVAAGRVQRTASSEMTKTRTACGGTFSLPSLP